MNNMKTGFGLESDQAPATGYLLNMFALLEMFMGDAIQIANQYRQLSGRNAIHAQDIVYALKYQARVFVDSHHDPEEFKRIRDELESELFPDVDSDSGIESDSTPEDQDSGTDSDSGTGSGSDPGTDPETVSESISDMIMDESEVDEFCRAPEDSDLVRRIHQAVDTWQNWEPESPLEMSLKASVEKSEKYTA